jgi:hypothetical protein
MIATFRGLSAIDRRAAELAAPRLEDAIQRTASAGTTPEGEAWAPTKKGGRAMANAAAHVTAKAYGSTVRVKLDTVDVFHHFGRGASEVRRRVIPDPGTRPRVVDEAVRAAMAEAFAELTGGGP